MIIAPFSKKQLLRLHRSHQAKIKRAIFPPLEPFLVAIDTIPEINFHVFIFKFSLLYLTILKLANIHIEMFR